MATADNDERKDPGLQARKGRVSGAAQSGLTAWLDSEVKSMNDEQLEEAMQVCAIHATYAQDQDYRNKVTDRMFGLKEEIKRRKLK